MKMSKTEVIEALNTLISKELLTKTTIAGKDYYSVVEPDCLICEHHGQQSLFPSNCTGCGAHGEFRNFKVKVES